MSKGPVLVRNGGIVSLRSTFVGRFGFIALGVGMTPIVFHSVVTNGEWYGLAFLVPGVGLILEGLRQRLEVDLVRRVVISQRAVLHFEVPIDDVDHIIVPGKGPMALVLRSQAPSPRFVWPRGVVRTSFYADGLGNDRRARSLAVLIGVPVRSPYSKVRFDPNTDPADIGPPPEIPPLQRALTIALIAAVAMLLVVMITSP